MLAIVIDQLGQRAPIKKGVDMSYGKTSKKPGGKKPKRPPKKNGGKGRSPKPHRRLPGDLTTDAPPPKPKKDDED